MQENRSFDHYFGALRGVCSFGDPHPMTLPDTTITHPLSEGHLWYDFRITAAFHPRFDQRRAGHFENGRPDRSEPFEDHV